jgi:hypothetical protein
VCSQPATTGSIPPSPLVQIYADSAGVTPITQPLVADGYGHTFFYVAPGTYTIVYNSPQILTQVLADQTIGAGNVSFPITVAEGGTNATTASQARINLGSASSGANADITSLSAIGNTAINSSGYLFGSGTFGTPSSPLAQITSQSWTGSGFTGLAVGVQDASEDFSLLTTGGVLTNGLLQGNFLNALNTLTAVKIEVGAGTITSNAPNTTVTIGAQGITTNQVSLQLGISGSPVSGVGLVGFGSTIPVQSTVGSAGGASAPPATPLTWLQTFVYISGVLTPVVVPCYKPS